jgi:hypothetical protein
MSGRKESNSFNSYDTVVVGCEVMRAELEAASRGAAVQFHFLDQGLHRTPKKMAGLIQEKLALVGDSTKRVVLAYGLCSKGIAGVRSTRQGLVVPRCHDCIALFFGSSQAYHKAFTSRPGTYYLTSGWLAAKKDPLGIIYDDYAPQHGIEDAFWVMEEELKHYTHIALINTGVGNLEEMRARTLENCRVLKKAYSEIQGSLDYFIKLIHGPYEDEDFIVIPPGQQVTEDMFIQQENAG